MMEKGQHEGYLFLLGEVFDSETRELFLLSLSTYRGDGFLSVDEFVRARCQPYFVYVKLRLLWAVCEVVDLAMSNNMLENIPATKQHQQP